MSSWIFSLNITEMIWNQCSTSMCKATSKCLLMITIVMFFVPWDIIFTKGSVLLDTFHDKIIGSIGRHSRPVNLAIWKCYLASKCSCHACSYMQSLWEEQMGLATNQKEAGDHSGSMTPTLERLTCWETCPFIGQTNSKKIIWIINLSQCWTPQVRPSQQRQVGFVGSRHLWSALWLAHHQLFCDVASWSLP